MGVVFFYQMMKSVFLFVALFAALSYGQDFVDVLIIDDYIVETPLIVIIIPANPSFPLVESRMIQDSDILGGERDLQLSVLSGDENLAVTSGVAAGSFSCATPNEASGESLIQYDGIDGTAALDGTGLGSVDFTALRGQQFRTVIESDQPTNIEFRVYTNSGSVCRRTVSVPGDDAPNEYILPFTSFTGSCNFANVGAFEILVDMRENVDVLLELVSISGPPPTTPTPTRTQSPLPSASRSITPSASNTCVCRCPVFTCEVFRVDDQYYFYSGFFGYFFSVGFFNFGFFTNFFTTYFGFFSYYFGFFNYYFNFYFYNYYFNIWYWIFN